ncbi:MAG: entry exclusion lipoprotein TrbK [Alcaligenaceae bacterium]|nr:entry exclusion lipoprotein TrbK [Alcaligenaceae bacterium]
MKPTLPFVLVLALTACGQPETPEQTDILTVKELASNPGRLKELRQQCQTDRDTLDDVLCKRVADATRKRFYGDGKVPYTPSEMPPAF